MLTIELKPTNLTFNGASFRATKYYILNLTIMYTYRYNNTIPYTQSHTHRQLQVYTSVRIEFRAYTNTRGSVIFYFLFFVLFFIWSSCRTWLVWLNSLGHLAGGAGAGGGVKEASNMGEEMLNVTLECVASSMGELVASCLKSLGVIITSVTRH
jgi:hypothetical protein